MWRRTAGRWRRAMSALAVVAHRSTALPSVLRRRQFTVSGSAAYQPAALTASPSPTGTGLPAKIAPAEPPAATPLTAPVAADAVVIGKFDRGRQARMRAFYSAEGLCARRSEEHTSELHHVAISYAVFCLKKKKIIHKPRSTL